MLGDEERVMLKDIADLFRQAAYPRALVIPWRVREVLERQSRGSMNVDLLDQDGHTVRMTKEDIAESLRVMGNVSGFYMLLPVVCSLKDIDGRQVVTCNIKKVAGKKKSDELIKSIAYPEEKDESGFGVPRQPVLQFRPHFMPNYSWWQKKVKEWRWNRGQRQAKKQFDSVNTKGLIWKPTPFVLKLPWLRLKGKKAVVVNVE